MFELDMRSRDPIYQQLVEKFKSLIINQVMIPDEQLPSVRSLAQEMTINPNTIQKAYRELEIQGYIYSVKGKGSFVMPVEKDENEKKINTLKQTILKDIKEALFLGIDEEALTDLISHAVEEVKGENPND
ncbi:GntR family transcriptional regulator [Streptohalobacillus salinus]|uniref:GntR family transcriptional regulator n=1 Tax=Streptohalobacillus salinus TaxID=621096 RepID=A0A2V3WUM2_9BACI|nr:GntR family transcriptional regulator [Streptohalobacillus salinus]PXW92672.1 GntR family transcriptional regulator [Streptohalobacillus salinus]